MSRKIEKETIKKLLVETLYLSELLDFTLEDLINETKKKEFNYSRKIKKRLLEVNSCSTPPSMSSV